MTFKNTLLLKYQIFLIHRFLWFVKQNNKYYNQALIKALVPYQAPYLNSYFFRFGGTGGLLGNDTDSLGSEWSLSERERFDDVMETILIELESVCHDEQQFSIKFFKMDQISTNKDNTRNVQDAKKAKVAMEEARNMMAESFPTLDNELLHFISAYEKADSFFTLHALVR